VPENTAKIPELKSKAGLEKLWSSYFVATGNVSSLYPRYGTKLATPERGRSSEERS